MRGFMVSVFLPCADSRKYSEEKTNKLRMPRKLENLRRKEKPGQAG
jgi:hypothetical protein